MDELLNMKLGPGGNNRDLIVFIEKLSKDNELFKRFIVDLVEGYTKMMDQKTALQDSKIAQVTSKVAVAVEYIEDAEGLRIT